MQLRQLESYQQALRWDNVSTFPMWVNGIKPVYHAKKEMHLVHLEKNDEVSFRLPAYQSVRLYSPYQSIKPEDVRLTLSDGTGLALEDILYPSSNGHSLLLSPQSPKPLIVHLKTTGKTLDLGLFVSRMEVLGEIAPYRNLHPLSKNWVLLFSEAIDIPELYWHLPAKQVHKINVKGKLRLLIRHRLDFEPQAHELIQDYRIRYRLDGGTKQYLQLATSVDSSHEFKINSRKAVLSRSEEIYIEIPEGVHELELSADRNLYVQILSQSEHDYLFPQLNEPRKPVQTVRQQGLLDNQPQDLVAEKSKQQVKDNRHKESALYGVQLLKETALQRPDYPPLQREAEQLRGFRSFYRDLLPNHKASVQGHYVAYFAPKRLLSYSSSQAHPVLAPQHLQAVLKRVGKSVFVPLPAKGKDNANEYHLPYLSTDTELRLLVDKSDCVPAQRLWIQFDEQSPKALNIRCDEKNISPDDFVQTFFEVASKNAQHFQNANPVRSSRPDGFSHLISQHFQDGGLIDAAHFELPIERETKRIKIWRDASLTAPVAIALQYRASRKFTFSEQSYLVRLQETRPAELLKQFQQDLTGFPNDSSSPVGQELQNQWQPLKQLIDAQARLFKAAVADRESDNLHRTTQQRLKKLYAQAEQAETQFQWLEALEYRAQVVQHTNGKERDEAQFAQADLLFKLGEMYLAETLWRYLSLYAVENISAQATDKLRSLYEKRQNYFALQSLAASRVSNNPDAENIAFLIEALSKNQEYHLALLTGLTLMEQPPLPALIEAAYQLRWWTVYQQLVQRLPVSEQAFWQGLQAQAQGDYPAALAFWTPDLTRDDSGKNPSGLEDLTGLFSRVQSMNTFRKNNNADWARSLLEGLLLRDEISRSCGKRQAEYYQKWLDWQHGQPSEKHWQAATAFIKDYAGADTYYSSERDVYGKGFKATLERPVRLSLLGKRTLRFKIRPLHPAGTLDSALNGWIEIKDSADKKPSGLKDLTGLNSHRLHPFTNNTPSQGLKLVSKQSLQLGGLIEFEYEVGAGWHDIEIYSQQAELSVNVEEAIARTPLTALPRVNAYTFTGRWQFPQMPMLTAKTLMLINPFRATDFPSIAKGSQPMTLLRQAIRAAEHSVTQDWQLPERLCLSGSCQSSSCDMTKTENLVEKLKKLPSSQSTSLTISAAPISISEVLSLEPVNTLEQAQTRMMHYLRLFEDDAPNIEQLLLPAEKLRLAYPDNPLIQSLWQRIARHTQWQPLEAIEANAGLSFVEIEGWQPESPFIRTRKALQPYIGKREHIIFSDQRLVLYTKQLKPLSLHIDLRLSDVPFLPKSDALLFYRIDDRPPQSFLLQREQGWQRFTIPLPAGEHSLRFYQQEAIGNQFIKLRFDDHVSDLSFMQERRYFVSTHAEPVKIELSGALRLRVDEWENGRSKTRFINVPAGFQQLVFAPKKGQKQRLLRFRQWRLVFEPKQINNRIIEREIKPVPEPDVQQVEKKEIKSVHLHDEFKLGKQEDGTSSAGFDLVRRNNVQEDSNTEVPEQFAQYRINHRYFLPHFKTYSDVQVLARVREFGGPTLGLNYSQTFLPSLLPFTVTVNTRLMGQWVHDEFEWMGQLNLRASKAYQIVPKTRLIPSLTMFARHLSLKESSRLKDDSFAEKIDQDVYSPYKADHTTGLNFALLLEHRPWLDTLWTARLKLGSNEGFHPFDLDHVGTEFHWKQLLGEVELDAAYRMTFYQADNDREKSSKRSQFSLTLDWNRWLYHQRRFQLTTKYIYDIERRENLVMFSATLHFGEGRGLRDFRPSSLDFRHLMQRNIPDEKNNRIDYRH